MSDPTEEAAFRQLRERLQTPAPAKTTVFSSDEAFAAFLEEKTGVLASCWRSCRQA